MKPVERRPASSLAVIPERGIGHTAVGMRTGSASPRSRLRSVSAGPESGRNARLSLLPDLDDSPVTSPATRKRTSVSDEFLDNVSSPSKRQSLGAQSASTTQSADGKRKRRPVPAAVYANLQEKPDAPEAGVEPGSGVQSTGVTPLVSRLQVQSAVKRVDDLVDAEADFGGFRVASPGRSGGVGASGRRLSKRDKNSRKTNRIAPSIMGKYLGGIEGGSQHGLGRADARKVAGVLGRPLTMYAVTWNLAGKLPPASIGTIAPTQEVDVIAVGTQECLVNCGSVKSFVQPGKAKWEQRLQAVFGPEFTALETSALNAMHIAVFVRKFLLPSITNIKVEKVATGFMGMVGNKGGIAIKFKVNGSSICFINSHLAAHQSQVEQRHSDWARIEHELKKKLQSPARSAPAMDLESAGCFGAGSRAGFAPSSGAGEAGGAYGGVASRLRRSNRILDEFAGAPVARRGEGGVTEAEGIPSHRSDGSESCGGGLAEIVVWMGDLNYRIDLAHTEVANAVGSKGSEDLSKLRASDQLLKARKEGKVAVGYEEGPLDFLPTYKYDPMSDTYDTSKKARVPAWTDRILYRAREPGSLELLSYNSCDDVKSSDHRPVAALFSAPLLLI